MAEHLKTTPRGFPPLAETASTSRRRRGSFPGWPHVGLLVAGFLVALVALSFVLYRAGTHAWPVDADSATVVLEGAAMGHGNLFLSGWALSRDAFWTVDAVAYMLGVLVDGIHPVLLYAVPAVIAALVVLIALGLAQGQATRAGKVTAALVVLALLALPSRALSQFYLQGPYHVDTALYALLAFAGLRRRSLDWGWVAAVVLLGFGMIGDLQLAMFGVAPALGAGLLAMARRRSVAAGLPTVAAVPASILLAFVLRKVADLVGTFSVNPANPTASTHQMLSNLHDLVHFGPSLLGVGVGPYSYEPTDMPTALSDLHVILIVALLGGAVVAGLCALRGAVGGTTSSMGEGHSDWHLEDLLVLAFLADIAVFLRLDVGSNPQFGRYLTAAIIFGAILAARLVGRLTDLAARRSLAPAAAGVVVALFLAFGAGFGASVANAASTNSATALATLLEQHHLTRGLGDYWSASIVTVESSGAVVVRPVVDAPNGHVFRYARETDATWYAHKTFQFVVEDPALGLVRPADVEATFGHWSATYTVVSYVVFAFSHPIAVSTISAGA